MLVYRMMRAIAEIGLNEPNSLDESIRLITAFLSEQKRGTGCQWSGEQWRALSEGWRIDALDRRARLQHFRESIDLLLAERGGHDEN